MRIKLDLDLCQGHLCKVVKDNPGGYAQVVLLMEEPPESLRGAVMNAAKGCPNRVIRVED